MQKKAKIKPKGKTNKPAIKMENLKPSRDRSFWFWLFGVFGNYGTLLFNKFKHYNEAIADFTRAIELNPKGEYFYNRSNCYFRMGDIVKAQSDALIAIQKGFIIPDAYKSSLQL